VSKRTPSRAWTEQHLKLAKDHGWRAKPGHKIFVADRGAVRFDIPGSWVVRPGDDSIRITDRNPPADDCLLQLSVMYLRTDVNWSELPLPVLLENVVNNREERYLRKGDVVEEIRSDLELAWLELRVVDPGENREACSRICCARSTLIPDVVIQPLMTMDFWPEHADRFSPVWDEVLRSLTLGDWVTDPTRRVLH
jgi:hypothetical protein